MAVEVDGRQLRLTNLSKVLYPEARFTKAAVLDYYARIAPALLPHIRGRPMTLKRYPDGVAGPHFYDKHCAGRPDWLATAPMWSEHKRVSFAQAEAFARTVAEVMTSRMPNRVVARMDKRLRRGKVLVDWSQNDRHKSTVAAYSLRAKLGRPTVSMPVTWDELEDVVERGAAERLLIGPADALERVAERGDLFAPVLTRVQRLPQGGDCEGGSG